ncbi:hypothetical protein FQN60_007744 [Etheostoma spectabile]|uniref:Uncharacterized protein n=1 Tax=Etheostoma spectabile TaxID=54343 RepID=A0A5J5D0X8_9PERO|nr:hypothetical protein FQN60_007744 [Etheostoma spectabile]
MSARWRFGQAGDATPRELSTSRSLDSDDEAGQMIAVKSPSEFGVFCVAVVFCCSHGRIGSGKETESIMMKLAGECKKRHTEHILLQAGQVRRLVVSLSSPGSGVLSWGAAAEVDGDQAWSSEALCSSRQAPDALTYISLSQTGREMERERDEAGVGGCRERERERERERVPERMIERLREKGGGEEVVEEEVCVRGGEGEEQQRLCSAAGLETEYFVLQAELRRSYLTSSPEKSRDRKREREAERLQTAESMQGKIEPINMRLHPIFSWEGKVNL